MEFFSSHVIPKAYSPDDVTERAFGNNFMRRNGDSVLARSSNLLQADMTAPLPYHFVAQRLEKPY